MGPVFYQSDCEVSLKIASILTLALQLVVISYMVHIIHAMWSEFIFLLLIQEEKFSYTVSGDGV